MVLLLFTLNNVGSEISFGNSGTRRTLRPTPIEIDSQKLICCGLPGALKILSVHLHALPLMLFQKIMARIFFNG